MPFPGTAALLQTWDHGVLRHPIDRALLLAGLARPELAPELLPELPLGPLNLALLGLRTAWFGRAIRGYVDCPTCGERLELALDAGALVPPEPRTVDGQLELAGHRFRLPTSRDLAAVAQEQDVERAALQLMERCCVERPSDMAAVCTALLPEVEAGLEALDPAAEISLSLACEACGQSWAAPCDIGSLLWDEIDAQARILIRDIDTLARAYGWTEPDILALSPQRRAAYLGMVQG